MINITDKAREKLNEMLDGKENAYFRIFIEGFG
jgi:Fe-S cluster assembly iron-binding protein IscA